MDNERPIEKLLRDYAKRRRADAGETLEMHPATRRILQGEVARQFPKSQRTVSPLVEFFARWRPGFVYALCVLAIVAVSVPLLRPMFRKAQPDTRLAAAVPGEEAADKKRPADSPSEADEALSFGGRQRSNEAEAAARALTDAAQPREDPGALSFEE